MSAPYSSVSVDPEIRGLIPPLSRDESAILEAALVRDGCRDPLVVWEETGVLLDGHNRHEICSRLGIPFQVVTKSFATRDEAILFCVENQLGRRNLSSIDRVALANRREPLIRLRAAENRGRRTDLLQNSAGGSDPVVTRVAAAEAAGVSHDTYTKGMTIIDEGVPELVQAVRDGDASIHAAVEIAKLPADEQVAAVAAGNLTEKAKTLRKRRAKPSKRQPDLCTPQVFIDAAREVLGEIDLDPASNDKVQWRIKAGTHYTVNDDGLKNPWSGRAWLHPPRGGDLQRSLVERLLQELDAGTVPAAVLLTTSDTSVLWFQAAAARATRVCFALELITFERPDGSPAKGSESACTFFYFGDDPAAFERVFGKFGIVMAASATAQEVA